MLTLYDVETGDEIGTISTDQLEELIEQFQEDSDVEAACWVDADALEMLEEDGGDLDLVTTLRKALKGRDEMEIRWERT